MGKTFMWAMCSSLHLLPKRKAMIGFILPLTITMMAVLQMPMPWPKSLAMLELCLSSTKNFLNADFRSPKIFPRPKPIPKEMLNYWFPDTQG